MSLWAEVLGLGRSGCETATSPTLRPFRFPCIGAPVLDAARQTHDSIRTLVDGEHGRARSAWGLQWRVLHAVEGRVRDMTPGKCSAIDSSGSLFAFEFPGQSPWGSCLLTQPRAICLRVEPGHANHGRGGIEVDGGYAAGEDMTVSLSLMQHLHGVGPPRLEASHTGCRFLGAALRNECVEKAHVVVMGDRSYREAEIIQPEPLTGKGSWGIGIPTGDEPAGGDESLQ